VSVVVCAYTERRWGDLLAAVGSVVGQLRAGDECILVIDHNENLWRRAASRFADEPAVRVLAGDQAPGLSGARNTGVLSSTGDVIAFLDDDAVAGPDWLSHTLAGFADPAVAGVGVTAVPRWPVGGRPDWFPPEYDWVVGCSYQGLPRQDAPVRNLIGVAMAFRRDVFAEAGLFSGAVGRVGTTPLGCEETELCIRLRQVRPGARLLYRPGAVVEHRVSPERTTVRYFLRRCFGEGVSKARVARLVGPADGLESERDYVRRTLPRAAGRELARAARGRAAGAGAFTMIGMGVAAAGLGYLREKARYPRSPVPPARHQGEQSRGRPHPRPAVPRRRAGHADESLADQRR
jgi:glycosyltransferase involved in cell wall biosynthesis